MIEEAGEFAGLTPHELGDMQRGLVEETGRLQKERGKQQRLAVTITDQMYAEAQVDTVSIVMNQ